MSLKNSQAQLHPTPYPQHPTLVLHEDVLARFAGNRGRGASWRSIDCLLGGKDAGDAHAKFIGVAGVVHRFFQRDESRLEQVEK
jgi:hypothetical protein